MTIPARHSILPEYRIAHYSSLTQPHGHKTPVGLFPFQPKISYIYLCQLINSTTFKGNYNHGYQIPLLHAEEKGILERSS